MAMTLTIGEGSEEKVFEEAGRFSYKVKSNISGRGAVDSLEHSIVFTGKVISSVVDSVVDLIEEVTEKLTERRVQIKENGTTKIDLVPNDGYVGPFVTSFSQLPEDGSFTSHATFEIEIFFRSKGNADGGSSSSAYNFGTSLEVTKVNNRTIQKIWSVTASAKTLSAAESACMAFKPAVTDLVETTKADKEDATFSAKWVWTARRTAWAECEVSIEDPNKDYVPVPQASSDDYPILHRARNREITVTISGTVFDYSRDGCKAPPAHCQEGPNVKRRGNPNFDAEVANAEQGIYKRRFMEVYIATGVTPIINHSGHELISFKTPPDDGAMG